MESVRKVFLKPDPRQVINDKIFQFIKEMTEQKLITFYHSRHLRKFLNIKKDVRESTPENQITFENAEKET